MIERSHYTTPLPPEELNATRRLFLDDYEIEESRGLARVMNKPERHGAIIEPDPAIGEVMVQSRSAPQWNPEKNLWEWWYWGNHECEPYGPWKSTSKALCKYATSEDGIHWQKPSLGMFELDGSRENNILAFEGYEQKILHEIAGRDLYHCVRDERETDPARRYKGLFGNLDRCPAVSPDGFSWTRIEARSFQSSDESQIAFDPKTGHFLVTPKRGTVWGRSHALLTTEDFVEWFDNGIVMHADAEDTDGRLERLLRVIEDPDYLSPPLFDEEPHLTETYNLAIHPYQDVYIGLVLVFDKAGAIPPPHMNHTGLNQTQLAFSRDMLHWRRLCDRQIFLGVRPFDGKGYENQQVSMSGQPVVVGDEIRLYHMGARFRGTVKEHFPEKYHPYFNQVCALCLSTLRLDGYVSLDTAGADGGELLTRRYRLAGETLKVNVNAAKGRLRAEVVDAETLAPLPGFSLEESIAVEGDHLRAPLAWTSGAKLGSLRDREAVRIRFVLENARFYSFWRE